jgi:hypothetical protein
LLATAQKFPEIGNVYTPSEHGCLSAVGCHWPKSERGSKKILRIPLTLYAVLKPLFYISEIRFISLVESAFILT